MKYIETVEMPVSDIEMSEYKLRVETEAKDMDRLVRSIKEHGLIHPVAVRRNPISGGRPFVLIAGHRRLKAHELLSAPTVRAEVWDATDEELAQPELFEKHAEAATIVSNVLQVPLSLLELGRRLKKWQADFGVNPEQIADIIDKDVTTVEDALKLALIADEAQEVIEANPDTLTMGQLFALADEAPKLPAPAQVKLTQWMVEQARDKTAVIDHSAVKRMARGAKREAMMEAKPQAPGRPQGAKTRSDLALTRRLFKALDKSERNLAEFKALDKPRFISYTEITRLEERAKALGKDWAQTIAELKEALAKGAEASSVA
jgi:ParB/RepB/Spo0J family partition protein